MNITIPAGSNITFKCVGQGYGFVDVSWVIGRGDNERFPHNKSTVTTMATPDNITAITSILTIPYVNDGDGRNFRCIYRNSIGEMYSATARLTIGSKYIVIMFNYTVHVY